MAEVEQAITPALKRTMLRGLADTQPEAKPSAAATRMAAVTAVKKHDQKDEGI